MPYKSYNSLDLPAIGEEILASWKWEKTFESSVINREGSKPFVFYEGPPSANGKPGIHHVMARTLKDLFCRYKTMQGFQVKRKSGWDTHGLPIELQVEKKLGIRKEDIGKSISVEEYNKLCREDVMAFTDIWEDLTHKMGYWVDLQDPYITYKNEYIESVWNLLKRFHEKGLLYKGYSIQPFSPAAGTGLSSHELNTPGAYKAVKDTSVVAQFELKRNEESEFLYDGAHADVFLLAWTTTPWTLPSNTALGTGAKIDYILVNTYNVYTGEPISVVLAEKRLDAYFKKEGEEADMSFNLGDKQMPYRVVKSFKGSKLSNLRYVQLFDYAQPEDGDAFKVLNANFVSTADGTGIVHLAPSFGSDDFRAAKQNGIGSLTLVDRQGRFIDTVTDYRGEAVKIEYYSEAELQAEMQKQGVNQPAKIKSVDVKISIKLKERNRAFKVEKYEHNYPHCWRTDKPILYYPLDSWFIKTTAFKERLIELNKTINWKPEHTGTNRFGDWLENLIDWNLSRSRYWGTPLPIWASDDYSEQICIGSIEELRSEIAKAKAAGVLNPDFGDDLDLHRPYVDRITLVSPSGKEMKRELDLIDVWFDSGSMPYAQQHFPFENLDEFKNQFPADFIAEGVDQTRGWFFTLHAISVMLFDSIAFKNVISNGLVLDKDGQKMSKRLGNGVDPFETIDTFGADATRWYLVSNSNPWDNLKFDSNGLAEIKRKFFGTLYNSYSFFSLYANIDGFDFSDVEVDFEKRPELDRWVRSELETLTQNVTESLDDYEPTKAARMISKFVDLHLSNWYVRLSRRRFWKESYSQEKLSAFQTLYTCLERLSLLMAPFAPFYSDKLFRDLNAVSGKNKSTSVHLADFPKANIELIDKELERQMELAQSITSLVLSIRKKEKLKVRQPLLKILVPASSEEQKRDLARIANIILNEVNVKEMEIVAADSGMIRKSIKPNFPVLGKDPELKRKMKFISKGLVSFGQIEISKLEQEGSILLKLEEGKEVQLLLEHVVIGTQDIPGWQIAGDGEVTIALDLTLNDELINEGLSREIVNRIQKLRKDSGFEVVDRINVSMEADEQINNAVNEHKTYICAEILADNLNLVDKMDSPPHLMSIEGKDFGVELKLT